VGADAGGRASGPEPPAPVRLPCSGHHQCSGHPALIRAIDCPRASGPGRCGGSGGFHDQQGLENRSKFKIDDSVQLLASHDVYFISFFMEDQNYALAMNSGRFTVFTRSGHSKMLKVNKEYFLSSSELRLHEVSTMVFNPNAYWASIQRTSWSDFHKVFNAVQHEYESRGQWT
jgi:hypothetical protein